MDFDGIDNVNEYAGGVDLPHTGPYDLVAWNQNQKIYNLRESWWAIEAGLSEVPDVKRVVIANLGGTIGHNMDTVAQHLVNNEMDSALDMRQDLIASILEKTPISPPIPVLKPRMVISTGGQMLCG